MSAEHRVKGWPEGVQAIKYQSAADNTPQSALLYVPPEQKAPTPLLVALHTWSYGYDQPSPFYADWCKEKGWVLIHPDFRGPSKRPEAGGSELVVKDIVSAVEHAKKTAMIDPQRIYLIGASGGGYASLLMAGRTPEIWAGVSAWVPIFDLADWHADNKGGYPKMVELCCGGAPGQSPTVDEEYRRRSPSAWLAKAKGIPLDINTGIKDGHSGSVPVSHALKAFNSLVAPADAIPAKDIAEMCAKPEMPARLLQKIDDPNYAGGAALYRRISGNARVTVFDGGHIILHNAGLAWLEQQRKGAPPEWAIKPVASGVATEVGK